MYDIISFGSAVLDIFLETGVDERGKFMAYPIGEKILVKGVRFYVGGGGTNTAVAFSRLGFKTGYIGKLDSEFGGREILKLLKSEKVKFLGKIEKHPKDYGGYSVILDSKERNRTVLTYKGFNEDIKFSDLKKGKIKTRWIYFSSALNETFRTQKKLAQILHEKGVKIAYNPSMYIIKKENLAPLLKITDILILNKEEGEDLAKGKNVLERLKKMGPKIVVVTDGKKPAYAYDGVKKYSITPRDVKVVETTGAGDAFASGFVAGQMVGKSIEECMKLGLEESEAVIQHYGSKNNLIKRKLK